jgi:hypothetical protein
MDINELMGDDLRKFRIITGYSKFNVEKQRFMARPHHTVFYAKDRHVLNFMVIMAKAPQGQLVQEVEGEFPVCLN